MPSATVVIVTRNRREMAGRAVQSALDQSGDVEVVVVDDASTDDTAGYLRASFPTVKVDRSEQQAGLVVQRTRAAEMARGAVLVSIDDDAVFLNPDVVSKTLTDFEHPRVGAVSIPFVNHSDGQDHRMIDDPPDDGQMWVRPSFIGTAYAVRRDLFRQLGGFEGRLFHWAEEPEFCQRLLGAGYVVAAGRGGLIRHFPVGVGKYTRKTNRYIMRNALLVPWLNAPIERACFEIAGRTAQAFLRSITHPSQAPVLLEGLALGYGAMAKTCFARRPLPRAVWRLWQELRKRRLVPLHEIEARLPPLAPLANVPG